MLQYITLKRYLLLLVVMVAEQCFLFLRRSCLQGDAKRSPLLVIKVSPS